MKKYWLAPAPPFRPRNKDPRTDVVIIQFVFIIPNMIKNLFML